MKIIFRDLSLHVDTGTCIIKAFNIDYLHKDLIKAKS